MWRPALLVMLGLAGCSKGPQADQPSIKQARSLSAEWATVNEQASAGRLTAVYVDTMHRQLRENLQATAKSLSDPGAGYAMEIAALLREPDDAAPEKLKSYVTKLKREEQRLESA